MIENPEGSESKVIVVKVGEREFLTAFDREGVQCFIPHDEGNPELTECLRPFKEHYAIGGVYEKTGVTFSEYDPNQMFEDFNEGRWTLDDVLFYATGNGWPVDIVNRIFLSEIGIENPHVNEGKL